MPGYRFASFASLLALCSHPIPLVVPFGFRLVLLLFFVLLCRRANVRERGGARRAAGRPSVGRVQRVMLWVAAVRRRHTRNSRGAQVAPSRHPDARGATSAPNNGNTVSVGVNPAANEEPGERSPDLQWQEYARDQHANRGVEVNSIQCMICLQK